MNTTQLTQMIIHQPLPKYYEAHFSVLASIDLIKWLTLTALKLMSMLSIAMPHLLCFLSNHQWMY